MNCRGWTVIVFVDAALVPQVVLATDAEYTAGAAGYERN